MRIEFTVFGNPTPWRRARRKGERYYTHHKVVEWQEEIIGAYLEAYSSNISFPAFPDGAVALTLRFYRGDHRRCDLDNLEKNVMDALQGYVWADDWQIERKESQRFYDKENPRVEVEAWQTDEG